MSGLAELAAAVEQAAEALTRVLGTAGAGAAVTVSPTQLRVLTLMRDNPDLNVNRLAEALDVVPSSASRMCDRLEALGLLHRTSDPRNRREVQLRMTRAAARVLDQLSRRRRDALQAVLARMPDSSRRELLRSLDAFSAAAREEAGTAADRTA